MKPNTAVGQGLLLHELPHRMLCGVPHCHISVKCEDWGLVTPTVGPRGIAACSEVHYKVHTT